MVKQTMVVSMRISSGSGKRLQKVARRHGWSVSDTSARLVEEGLRRGEFAFIDFRDSAVGRQAYMQGSSLAVWEVVMLARNYSNDSRQVARHLNWGEMKVQAALNYAKVYPGEIEAALEENAGADAASLSSLLPQLEVFKTGKK